MLKRLSSTTFILVAGLVAMPSQAYQPRQEDISLVLKPSTPAPIQVLEFRVNPRPPADWPRIISLLGPRPALPKAPRKLGRPSGRRAPHARNPNGSQTGPPR